MWSSRLTQLLAAAVLVIAVPSTSQAQFDRLVKKAAEKIGNPEGKSERPAAAPQAGAPAAAASSHITVEQLDAFIAAVGPAAQQAQQRGAWRAQKAAHERKHEEYARCREQALAASLATPAEVDEREMDRIQALSESLSSRMTATSDLAKQRVLSDSMMLVIELMQDAMYPAVKRCGARPAALAEEPAAIDAAGVAARAKERGFSPAQFGQLRERIGIWLTARESRGLSSESVAALQAREAQLRTLAPYFEEVQWGTWSDLPNW